MRRMFAIVLATVLAGSPGQTLTAFDKAAALKVAIPPLLAKYHAAGTGVVVIRDYRIAWSGFYGEQAPGVPATASTMFNGASLAKTVTAETTLRLATQGKLSLDEPVWRYYVHPSLAQDLRYKLLTPRIILSHRTGLLNWAYEYKNGKLAFLATPGTRFGYSGAGYEILAHFLEKKLGIGFDQIVQQTLLDPLNLKHISVARHPWMDALVTTPMGADGKWAPSYRTGAPENPDHPIRAWSAAADLFAAPEDYARFLIAVMQNKGVTPKIARERTNISSSFEGSPDWVCSRALTRDCPKKYGFGLGWMVFRYAHESIVSMGGNDSGENALVYYSPERPGSGVVIFVNGGGVDSVRAELDIIDMIDPQQKLTAFYRQLIAHHLAEQKK